MTTRARPGRPRHAPDPDSDQTPRTQILDAAAALFVEHGFAATSTRMIAERVGIRQASLYYHFAGKDDILVDLLTTSVRPSLEVVRSLEAGVPEVPAAAALYALAEVDVGTLLATPHNVGTLYLLPETQHERYDSFRRERDELQDAYGRLGAAAAVGLDDATTAGIGALLIQVVEIVIQLRRVRTPDADDTRVIAESCLRLCGLGPDGVQDAAVAARGLLDVLD